MGAVRGWLLLDVRALIFGRRVLARLPNSVRHVITAIGSKWS